MATVIDRIRGFLDERAGLNDLVEIAQHKRVPTHRHTLWYYTGGFTLFLFCVQAATGVLLLLYYRPTANEAFESVQFIVTDVPFGWLIRSIHSWAANLMILAVHVHMFAVLFLKAYRRPREVIWVSGVLLFALSLTFGFSGYLLPWNQRAFFATRVGTDIPSAIPVVGPFMVKLLRGGNDVTGATLTRLFGLHVAILPMIAAFLLAVHILLIQRFGMSLPPSIQREADAGRPPRSISFLPSFVLRESIGWLIAVAMLAALAAFAPWELGVKADPFSPAPAGIRPEWFFLWMFQTLKVLPSHILGIEGEIVGIIGFSVIGLGLLLLPFLEGSPPRPRISRAITVTSAVMLVYIIVMTVWSYYASIGAMQ